MAGHEKKKKTASCWRYRKTDADCCPRFHRPALVEGSAQVHRPLVRRRPVRRVHAYRPQRQYCHIDSYVDTSRGPAAGPTFQLILSWSIILLAGVQHGRRPGVNQDPPPQVVLSRHQCSLPLPQPSKVCGPGPHVVAQHA